MIKIGRQMGAFASCLCLLLMLLIHPVMAAGEAVKVGEHELSITLPAGAILLNEQTAAEQEELIESFGYTVSSFKNYLKLNQILIFATDPESKLQISVKTWESDFSADAEDMAYLSEEALASVARELVTASGASYKTVSVGSMRLLEIRSSGTDSGGDFCSVQYVTIRNGAFYSINTAFAGTLDESKVQLAWELIGTLAIKNTAASATWDVSSIFEMVLISALIVLAMVAIVIVIISFVKDIRGRRTDATEEVEYIERRSRLKRK